MKLQNEVQLDIPVSEMKDGQIGVITQWLHSEYVGYIIQRYDNMLISLQKSHGDGFDTITNNENCRVRILQKGEILIIE